MFQTASFFPFSNLVNCGSFSWVGEPRTAVLHKGKKGFGFVLRGAKAASPLMEMIPSEKCPGLQYMDDVDPGGVADMAGLRKGDFLLEVICSFFDLEPLLNIFYISDQCSRCTRSQPRDRGSADPPIWRSGQTYRGHGSLRSLSSTAAFSQ